MIFDCFRFNNELMLLEIRLKELALVIDKFVLVESTHTNTGEEKPLYYDEVKNDKIFGPFKNKIIHIIYNKESLSRKDDEQTQQDAIEEGLSDAKPDDTIIFSDVDEIINLKVVDEIRHNKLPGRLRMKFFYYYFNCRANTDWKYPMFCRFRYYQPAHILRNGSGSFYQTVINKAGWHFSYLMPAGKIGRKISQLANHIEYNTAYFKNAERIQKCMDDNMDLFDRPNMKFSIEPLDAPVYVMENVDKYKDYIK